MRDILEKLTEADKEQEDRYDPENLRSGIIEMFYKEGYSLDSEQKVYPEIHLTFIKSDWTVKVII